MKTEDKKSLNYKIRQLVFQAAEKVVGKGKVKFEEVVLEHPAELDHGDYSTNIAMRFSAKFSGLVGKAPWDLANEIVNNLRSQGLPDFMAKIEVAPPGFINIFLTNEYLISQLFEVLKKKEKYGSLNLGRGKTVVVDYSSPNIAKPFGIGHLRSTIIGQALVNLYKFLGYKVISDNHLGDWGTQFGVLIYQIKEKKLKLKNLKIEDLEKLYVEFHKRAEIDPSLMEKARFWFKKLEEKDPEARKIWEFCLKISLKEFLRIYDLLGVKFDFFLGESFYEDKMAEIIAEARKKGLACESQGALIIPLAGFEAPLILLKSDGATTYETRELATIKYRVKRWKPYLIIWEVGVDQKLHFQKCFAAAKMLGYGKTTRFVHVPHGLIRWEQGKFSTRKGETIHLEEVLEEAIKRAEKIISASETGRGLSSKKQKEVAKAVGIGAIVYFDLSHHPQTDIIFDWEKIFVLEGNSGPYLQYTYARCLSVLRKSKKQIAKKIPLSFRLKDEELTILRLLYRFPEIVKEAALNYSPNLLANFLFDLAQKYNLFYQKHPILKSEEAREFRLALTASTSQILKNGLGLLGIKTPERM